MRSSLVVRLGCRSSGAHRRAHSTAAGFRTRTRRRPRATWSACCRNPLRPSTASPVRRPPCSARSTSSAYSRFLSDAVLKNPERILQVANSGSFYRVLIGGRVRGASVRLSRRRSTAACPRPWIWRASAGARCCASCCATCWAWPRLAEVTEELSNLADAILDVAYRRIRADFVARHGEPRLADGGACGFSVIALGKLGGQGAELQLRYRPDVRLQRQRRDRRADAITNKEFYKKVANQYTALLSTYTAEGQCYRVDLRLRPDGTLGEVCDLRGRRARLLRGARARLGKADADQGARGGGRAGAGRGAAGVRRAADLPEFARFPRGGSGLGNAPAHRRERWPRGAASAAASISS